MAKSSPAACGATSRRADDRRDQGRARSRRGCVRGARVNYRVGGSVASSARTTLDVDLVADLRGAHVTPFVEWLQADYYVDADMIVGDREPPGRGRGVRRGRGARGGGVSAARREQPISPAALEPFGLWLERHVPGLVSEIQHRPPFVN